MKNRTTRIFRYVAAFSVAATASLAFAQNVTIPFDPTPSMYVPQAALDPPRPTRSQNVGVARGQSVASSPTPAPARPASPAARALKSVDPNGTRRAVLFAVGEFNDSEHLPPLDGTRNDMALIYERLTAQGDVSPERIVVLSDGGDFAPGVELVEPTCANFTTTVKNLAAEQAENDVLFVFVSTHGGSRAAEKDAKTGRSFICPKDAVISTDKVGDDGETEEEFVRFAEANNLVPTLNLLKEIQESKGKIVVIIDACQNDLDAEKWEFGSEFDEWTRELREKTEQSVRASASDKIAYADSNITILTACSSGQTSRQITVDGKTYGAFTFALAEGLAGAADRYGAIDGEIKLLEVYNYASGKTRRLTNGKQIPGISEAADAYKVVVTTAPKEQGLNPEAAQIYNMVNSVDAVKNVKNSDNLSKVNQFAQIEPDDVDANYLEGYFWRLAGSALEKARGAAWTAALDRFDRAGEEFTLFIDGSKDYYDSRGCVVYEKATARRADYVKNKENGKTLFIPHGSAAVIDRIEKVKIDGVVEYRARISRIRDMPRDESAPECWVSCSALNWTRTLAETTVATHAPTAPVSQAANAPFAPTGVSPIGAFNMPRPAFNL